MDKEVRSWNVYIGLELTIKNLVTSLKIITELQNPAMRERHWHQLMGAVGVSIFLMPLLELVQGMCSNASVISRGRGVPASGPAWDKPKLGHRDYLDQLYF